MEFAIEREVTSKWVKLTVTGRYKFADMKELAGIVKEEADKAGLTKALVDLLGVEGKPMEMDRFELGVLCANLFGRSLKVAVVYPVELINKLAETAAVNRGANMIVVGTVAEAEAWLEAGG